MLRENIPDYDQQCSHWTQYEGFLAALDEVALICSPDGDIFLANQSWHKLLAPYGDAESKGNLFRFLASAFADADGEINNRLRAGFRALNSQTKFTIGLPNGHQFGEHGRCAAIQAAVFWSVDRTAACLCVWEIFPTQRKIPPCLIG